MIHEQAWMGALQTEDAESRSAAVVATPCTSRLYRAVGVKQCLRHRFTMTTAMTIPLVIRYLSFSCDYLPAKSDRFIFAPAR